MISEQFLIEEGHGDIYIKGLKLCKQPQITQSVAIA